MLDPVEFRILVESNRSIRRFKGDAKISDNTLSKIVEYTRFAPSGRNLQPIKYIIANKDDSCDKIFPCLKWAKDLKDWDGPTTQERPSSYIIILGDKSLKDSFGTDQGICAQTLTLGSASFGLGSCIIASIKRDKLRTILGIPDQFEILLIVAIGVPAETVQIEPLQGNDSVSYWRDDNDIHHVPKRILRDLILRKI